MKVDLSGLSEKQRAEHLAALEVHKLKPRRTRQKRVARVCPVEEPRCGARGFGDPAWVCPTHARGVDQPNRPYFGVPTSAA